MIKQTVLDRITQRIILLLLVDGLGIVLSVR